jgi:hypothetical protein
MGFVDLVTGAAPYIGTVPMQVRRGRVGVVAQSGARSRSSLMATRVCSSATGTVTRIGNTSRTVAFEARKVIASRYDRDPSAADVLAEPVVTCRAIGTTVIPKDHSRKAPDRLSR